jgi:tetratricopeptide (TPR) repeat protein
MKRCWMMLAALLLMAPQTRPEVDAAAFAAALADYRAGEHERAFDAFSAMVAQSDLPRARLNAALCALQLLRSRDAEELVAPLTEVDGVRADAAFVLGMAARQHGERAVVAAKLPDAEPMAWVMASRAMQRSELQFREAVRRRPDWQEAVRNLERTLRRRAEVEAEREAAKPKESKKEEAPEPEPQPEPPKPDQPPEVVIPEVANAELSAQELEKLQQRVRAQQRQKVRGRQQRSRENRSTRGRDW